MPAQNLAVAVVGMAGAGKSEVTNYLVGVCGFERVYFGQVVLDEVAVRGLPPASESERIVREQLRLEEGMAVMAARSLPQIRALLGSGRRVCIDGLYSGAEWDLLAREIKLVTLAVHAPRWLRKARIAERPVRPLTAVELDERDLAEVEQLDKAAPIALADLHVVNDGTLEDLWQRVAAGIDRLDAVSETRLNPAATMIDTPSSRPD